jgi:hypothetical protein
VGPKQNGGGNGVSDDDVVTVQSGKGVAYEWAKHNSLADNAWQSQRRSYSKLLTDRCVAEAVRVRETEYDFWDRLNRVGEILESIKNACAQPLVLRHLKVEDVPEPQRPAYLKANEIIWQRHDVSRVHDLGYEESGYPGVDRKALAHAAGKYLERPWLRLAALDWLIVDALITDEIVQYGDALKRSHLPGPTDPMGRFHFDEKTKGNVKAILREGRKYRKHPVRTWFGYQVVFPVVTIGTSIYFQYWKTALAFVVLTVFDWCWMAVRWIARAIRRARATPEQLRTPEQNDYARLLAMRQVHRLLEGPVLNPKLVREEMVKTTDGGAVWDSAAWAVVDRVISVDPNVWVNSFPSTD